MRYDLVVRSRRAVLPDGTRAAAVAVSGQVIAAIEDYGAPLEAGRDVDLGDLPLLPGLVDTHVHVNEPGRTEWEGFATATRAAAAGGVTTICDMPLNSLPPTTSVAALEVISLVRTQAAVTNVAFLADLYHLGKMGEDLPGTLAREAASIAHIQVADVPDRGAPGTGELDCAALFGQLAAQGYAGWIGCEYKPSDPADSSTSFGWREPHGV